MTLYSIARANNVTVGQIAAANGLKAPYSVHEGQVQGELRAQPRQARRHAGQARLEMRAGLVESPGFGEGPAEVEERHVTVGVGPRGMAPERDRVAPDGDLPLGEEGEPADEDQRRDERRARDGGRDPARPPGPPRPNGEGANEHRPADARQVGIAVRGDLRTVGEDPGDGQ